MKKLGIAIDKIFDNSKLLWICRIVFFAVIIFVIISSSLKMIKDGGDIEVYFHAAKQLLTGNDIYSTAVSSYQLHYIYLPLFAVLYVPLTIIPRELAIFLWTTLNVFLLGWITYGFYKLISGTPLSKTDIKTRWTVLFFSIALSFDCILVHLKYGQTNILVMAMAVLSIKLIEARKEITGGLIFGLAAVIKIIIFPSIAWYLFQKKFKVIVGAFIGTLVGLLIPGFIVGFEKNIEYIKFWTEKIALNGDLRNHYVPFLNNISLQAVFYRLFSNVSAFEYRGEEYYLTIFPLPDSALSFLGRVIGLTVIAVILIYRIKYRKSSKLISHWGGLALSFTFAPLFTGVAEKYHFVLLLPAYIYVIYLWHQMRLQNALFRGLVIISFALTTLTAKFFFGEFLNKILFALGCISWGAIALAGAIFCAASCFKNQDLENRALN